MPLRIGWARRIGIIAALLLAGVSAAFAAQSLAPRGPGQTTPPPASATPPVVSIAGLSAPVLDQPAELTTAAAIEVSGRVATELPAGGPYRLRIYVNDELQRDVKIARRDTEFTVADVPLAEGANAISASIAGPADETARSAAVNVERDGTAPRIDVESPVAGGVVYGDTLLLSGTTEPRAAVNLADTTNGAHAATSAGDAGAFSLLIALRPGTNELRLTAVDVAGNVAHKEMTVSRQESQASVTLELSRDTFDVASLPQAISIVARVAGHDGLPLDGADVTFSISPPGQMTVTHQAESKAGVAAWSNYSLAGGQKGSGLVTVLVTLPGGQTLAESATFSYR